MSFANLGLRTELLRALGDAGYTTPTPVQAQAIPVILQGRDVLAGAQTGTGKTAAFTIPLLQRLFTTPPQKQSGHRRPIRALILTPTRELAAQIEESVHTYGKYLPLHSTSVYGGVNIYPQVKRLQRGVDILVATPGRLLDHVQQRTLNLSQVEILVLDEADRMLDMGFIRDIRQILTLLPAQHQNLLFSATFSTEIKTLADSFLNNPERVEVARQNNDIELVTQSVYLASKENKHAMLVHLLAEEKIEQALIFTRTKHGADRLVKQLQLDGISALPIHGNCSQFQRTRALADFKAGHARLLVATDLASRGLDIDQLPHVINYELPNSPEDYIHRIGRTGRAGRTGEAISLVGAEEQGYLFAIERMMKKRIPRRQVTGFAGVTGRPTLHNESRQVPATPTPPPPAPRPDRPAPTASESPRPDRRFVRPGTSPRPTGGAQPPKFNKAKRAPRPTAGTAPRSSQKGDKRPSH